jgi:hypothetical protein
MEQAEYDNSDPFQPSPTSVFAPLLGAALRHSRLPHWVEGDTTSLYIAQRLKPLGTKVTRIAHGMPVGGDLDYANQATIIQAFEYRREL